MPLVNSGVLLPSRAQRNEARPGTGVLLLGLFLLEQSDERAASRQEFRTD